MSESKKRFFASMALSLISLSIAAFAILPFFAPKSAHAESSCTSSRCVYTFLTAIPGISNSDGTIDVSGDGASRYLKQLYTFGIAIAAVLAVIMITFAGVEYASTEAIQGKGDAKGKIQDALLGLALALLSFTLLNTINPNLVTGQFAPEDIRDNVVPGSGAGGQIGGDGGIGVVPEQPQGTDNDGDGVPDPVPNTGNWSWEETSSYLNTLNSTGRGTDGRLTYTAYGYEGDLTPDTNSSQARGNNNNLLVDGSVALSPDLIEKYKPQKGAAVFINDRLVGYFDDTTGSGSNNTIDFYNPSKSLGGNNFMKNVPAGQWNIRFGEVRPQTPNPR